MNPIARRSVLAAFVVAPVIAATSHAAATGTSELARLEQRYGARLGVWAQNTVTGQTIRHRAGERFAMCSTFKTYAAGALLRRHGLAGDYFDHRIFFTQEDLIDHSPVCETKVDTGMTVSELCEATITYSDNTAANLLLAELGGPPEITRFARAIGDPVSRLDRWEPELNEAARGDLRDTTTPAGIGSGYRGLVLGEGLRRPEQDQLTAWLVANTTGEEKIRAGVPAGWVTGDKTGGGYFATNNDVAVTWTAREEPLVFAVLSDKPVQDAESDNALIADTARLLAPALT